MTDDFLLLRLVDEDEKWRISESRRLGNLVQRRLMFLQVKKHCGSSYFVITINISKIQYRCNKICKNIMLKTKTDLIFD